MDLVLALLGGRWTTLGASAVVATFSVLFGQGYFRVNMASDGSIRLRVVAAASAIGVTVALCMVVVFGLDAPPVVHFVELMATLCVAAVIGQGLARLLLRRLWRRGWLRASAVVFGSGELAREMAMEINLQRQYGVDVVDIVAEPSPADGDEGFQRVVAEVRQSGAERLIIGPQVAGDDRQALRLARWAALQGMPVHVVPRFYQMGMGFDSMSPDRARGYPLVRMQRSAHPQLSIRLKRVMDVVVASVVLVLAAPLMAAVAVLVKATSPGPVLFSQERVGQHGKPIMVRKFRSMTDDGDGDTEWNPEARVTPLGWWLRRLNIDELPQLFAIVKGDMSLVGPRPERPIFVDRFRLRIPDYDDRHRMPAGLTGLAQVVGLRGDTSIAERVKYDNLYIDQWSLRVDVEILVRTLVAVAMQALSARDVVSLDGPMKDLDLSSQGARYCRAEPGP